MFLHPQCQRGFRHNEPTYESIWHYWQRMELPFTIYLPSFALPVDTLGRVSKLSRLLHKEIKPTDTPINGRPDWCLSYQDERPPRGILTQRHSGYTDGKRSAAAPRVKVTSGPARWCTTSSPNWRRWHCEIWTTLCLLTRFNEDIYCSRVLQLVILHLCGAI